MEGLKMIPYIALVLAISGIVIGAAVITMDQFGDTVTKCWNASYSYNSTQGQCLNNSDGGTDPPPTVGAGGNFTQEFFAIYQGMEGQSEIAEQLPTVAIIGIMVIIISIIAGVFVYLRYFS